MKHLIILLFLLFSSLVFAQKTYQIQGIIHNDEGKPINNVGVYLQNDIHKGTVTDDKGYFELVLPKGSHTLVVDYLGYKKQQIKVDLNKNKYLIVKLQKQNDKLNDVLITVNVTTRKKFEKLIGVDKIKIKQIEAIPMLLGEKDVLKAVQILPGVSAVSESGTAFSVHGGTADQNLISLDDAPIYHPSHLFGFFSVFIPEAVKNLHFYKSSIPPSYGNRLSSILDVKSKKTNAHKYTYGAGIGIISARGFIDGPIIKDKLSFGLSARRTYADLYTPYLNNKQIKNSKINFYDTNFRMDWKISKNSSLYFSGYKGHDVFIPRPNYNMDWGNQMASLHFLHKFNDKLNSKSSLIYSNYKYAFSIEENIDHQDYNFGLSAGITNQDFKQQFDYQINKNNNLNFGLDLNLYTITPGKIKNNIGNDIGLENQIERKAAESALFAQHKLKIGKRLKISYGVRASLFSRLGPETFYKFNQFGEMTDTLTAGKYQSIKNYLKFAPRISLNFKLAKELNLKAGYDKTYQFLHFLYNDATTTPTDLWIPSGINLKPQESDQYSIELGKTFGEKYYLSIGGYYRDIQHITDYRIGTTLSLSSQIEKDLLQGIGKAYGVEFLLKKSTGKLTGTISYTYSRTLKQFNLINEGKWYPSSVDRPHDVSIMTNYKFNKRSSISAHWVYYNGRPITFPAGTYELNGHVLLFFSHRNANRLPDYHRLDLSYTLKNNPYKMVDGKQIKKKYHSAWNFSIYNVYARDNTYMVQFKYDEDTEKINAYRLTLFKFVPSISYNIRF